MCFIKYSMNYQTNCILAQKRDTDDDVIQPEGFENYAIVMLLMLNSIRRLL